MGGTADRPCRSQGGVELDPKAQVDLHLIAIVAPRDSEDDLTFRLADAHDDLVP